MKADMNELLREFFYIKPGRELKGFGDAFLYGFLHAPQIIFGNWKDMREMEREEKRRALG